MSFHPPGAPEHDTSSLELLAVELARTPADHRVVAEHFRAKAKHARDEARFHELMGRAGGKTLSGRLRRSHCRRISKEQEAIAREYDALARLHEEEARRSE